MTKNHETQGPEDDIVLNAKELKFVTTGKDFLKMLQKKRLGIKKIKETILYEKKLKYLQIELIRLQRDVIANGRRVVILFEGRDAAGKGGTIRRYTQHLNPRNMEVVALKKPTETQRGQWYFQRYVQRLPDPGMIHFFDRSWYNRAVVEPVMEFCTPSQYKVFMQQVSHFEQMLMDDGIELIKFWFSISKSEQARRFSSRIENPLKQWKLSLVDQKAQSLWDSYTHYKEQMFLETHTQRSPWVIVRANNKKNARLESMRYLLSHLPYENKNIDGINLIPDPGTISLFHRDKNQQD